MRKSQIVINTQSTTLKGNTPKLKVEFYKARIVVLESAINDFNTMIRNTNNTIENYRTEILTLLKE
jgi:hypothetical protein